MELTPEGLALIKAHEGLRTKAYKCPAGVWTIGYGHTSAAGAPEVRAGMEITKEEAERILLHDLHQYEQAVTAAVKVDISPSQYSALVSFCYNVGIAAFRSSSVLTAVNQKRFDLVPSRLALWNKGNGKVLPGLVKRRSAEGDLFMRPVIGPEVVPSTVVTPAPGKPMLASTTNLTAMGLAAAGATSTVAQVTSDLSVIQNIVGSTAFAVAMGAIIVLGAGYIIYERFLKSKNEGV